RQRRDLRRGPRVRRVRRRDPRGAAAAGAVGGDVVPRPGRGPQPRAGGGDRPRSSGLPPPGRRRLRPRRTRPRTLRRGARMTEVVVRLYQPADLEAMRRLTVEAFAGVTLEQNVEEALGILNGRDWRWRKARHVDEDVAANPGGAFVAEAAGVVVGYVTT